MLLMNNSTYVAATYLFKILALLT